MKLKARVEPCGYYQKIHTPDASYDAAGVFFISGKEYLKYYLKGHEKMTAYDFLREKELIEPCGRLDVPGRPRLYRTTSNFLRVFGLTSLEELPEVPVPTSDIRQLEIQTETEEIPDEE